MSNTLPHDHGQSLERELEHVPSVGNFQVVSDIFKQMGDGSRVRIFWLLCHCEECVINLSAMVSMSSPAVSHHLKQLKAAGLAEGRRPYRQPPGGQRGLLPGGGHPAGPAAPPHDRAADGADLSQWRSVNRRSPSAADGLPNGPAACAGPYFCKSSRRVRGGSFMIRQQDRPFRLTGSRSPGRSRGAP